jgi:hypothetical protein
LAVTESDNLSISVWPDVANQSDSIGVRAFVGDVLVASTEESDRPEFYFEHADDSETVRITCRPPGEKTLLQDWIGLSEIEIRTRVGGESWATLARISVAVAAAKIQNDEFATLCDRLSEVSGALLLDVYGKTFIGISKDEKPGVSAPVIMVDRLQALCRSLIPELKCALRNPSFRLGTHSSREPSHPGATVSTAQLEAACLDPSMLRRNGRRPVFVEMISEQTQTKYSLYENKVISRFLKLALLQASELRHRITSEIAIRNARRGFRHRPKGDGQKTWWETEDLPRIEQLEGLLPPTDHVLKSLNRMSESWLLQEDSPLDSAPISTPLFRNNAPYSRLFRLMKEHFLSSRIVIDSDSMLKQIKSIPPLFEWWCVLEVMNYLNRSLTLVSPGNSRETPFKRLVSGGTDRFVVSLESEQFIDFLDSNDTLVRLRYEPHYRRHQKRLNSDFGLLSQDASLKTPDIAIEVYEKSKHTGVPRLIVILDAKYSRSSHESKLQELRGKYSAIGNFHTGEVLSRQIWALTPRSSSHAAEPDLRRFCTVDNVAFWNSDFDTNQIVSGAIEMRPASAETDAPLEKLLCLILRRAGVSLND